MLSDAHITEILKSALENTESGSDRHHEFDPSLQLVGENGIFDSLDTMLFLDSVDEQITEAIGTDLMLMGDDAFSRENNPFQTMGSLAAYIRELVDGMEL